METFSFFKNKNFLNIFIIILISIFFYKIFIEYQHLYPLHDEIISLDRYLEPKNFLRRDSTNNQLYLSFFGMLVNKIYGFEFYIFRSISFISFIGITILIRKTFNSTNLISIFFIIILSSDVLYNYIYLYRGYYVASFFLVLNLFFLKKYFLKKEDKDLKISLLMCFLIFTHSIYGLYFVIPILFVILIKIYNDKSIDKIKFIILYFFIPSYLVYSLVFVITGFAQNYPNNLNLTFLISNFFEVSVRSYIPGLKTVFFQDATKIYFSFISFINVFIKSTSISQTHQLSVLIIISLSIANILFKSLFRRKSFNYFDLLIIIFVIIFLIINRNPWLRVYVPISYLFIFYLLNEIQIYSKNNRIPFFKILSLFLSIILILMIYFTKPNNNYEELKKQILKIDDHKINCLTSNDKLSQYEVWVLINFYPNSCNYKYDKKKKENILF